MPPKISHRPFWLSFALTALILITALGLITVDYRGRRLSFGDDTPVATVEKAGSKAVLTVKAFGQERAWDVTELEQAWETVLDFGCIPHD